MVGEQIHSGSRREKLTTKVFATRATPILMLRASEGKRFLGRHAFSMPSVPLCAAGGTGGSSVAIAGPRHPRHAQYSASSSFAGIAAAGRASSVEGNADSPP